MADSWSSTVFWLPLCTSISWSTTSRWLSSFEATSTGLDCATDVSSIFGGFGLPVSYADDCSMSFALCNLRKTAASFELHTQKLQVKTELHNSQKLLYIAFLLHNVLHMWPLLCSLVNHNNLIVLSILWSTFDDQALLVTSSLVWNRRIINTDITLQRLCMEQFAMIRSSCNIMYHLPLRTEDIPTPLELCWPLNWLSSFTTYFNTSHLCKMPLQRICNSCTPITIFKQVVKVIWQQASLLPHMDSSVVLARWCQCARFDWLSRV